MHALNTNEEMKMKKVNFFGRTYIVKEDDELIGINTLYQVFTRNRAGKYKFIERRNDLVGKVNALPQNLSLTEDIK